jgi:hypothetical protein
MQFYQITGDSSYLNRVPAAIEWLEKTRLPEDKTENGRYTHPAYIELDTDRPVYVHRKGSNVTYGYYYSDYNDDHLLGHSFGKTNVPIADLQAEYDRLSVMSMQELTSDSPLAVGAYARDIPPQKFYNLKKAVFDRIPDQTMVEEIINSLDKEDRWLVTGAKTSNPYRGDGQKQEPTDKYASTNVGDETDTSPFRDTTDQEYISTGRYILNMQFLINYINSEKK